MHHIRRTGAGRARSPGRRPRLLRSLVSSAAIGTGRALGAYGSRLSVLGERLFCGPDAGGRPGQDAELRRALEEGQFFLVYQPTFDLAGMQVSGVEALLRWRSPRGVVTPAQFVPELERSGLIVPVGRWVLGEACRQGAAWRAGGRDVPVSVNVSACQLVEPSFVEDVRRALSSSGFPPGLLTLEITETAILAETERSAARLEAVRRLGVRIAVDDFGTGYSSLAHIQLFPVDALKIPVDALKIDRSFVSDMLGGREAGALVHTLVQLGKALGIETLAEGIEERSQLTHLQGEECATGQGYLLAEPLAAEELERFLDRWSARAPLGTP